MELESIYLRRDVEQSDVTVYDQIEVKMAGNSPPCPIESFESCDLHKGLKWLVDLCKYNKPTPVQKHSIPIIISGRNLVSCAETGSGKTVAFLLPVINRLFKDPPVRAQRSHAVQPSMLILCPTRELCNQIYTETLKLTYRSFVGCAAFYGGRENLFSFHPPRNCLIVTGTPGRVVDMLKRRRLDISLLDAIVLDEADRMLGMGFISSITSIMNDFSVPITVQKLMFSATFPEDTQRLAAEIMGQNFIFLTIGNVGKLSETVHQEIIYSDRVKKDYIIVEKLRELRSVYQDSTALVLVFVNLKASIHRLTTLIGRLVDGADVTTMYGGMPQSSREFAYESFKKSKFGIMITTDVSQRGLDICNIVAVINYDMPKTIQAYAHRIGRVARLGRKGKAISFFGETDVHLAGSLVSLLKSSNSPIPKFLRGDISREEYCEDW